LYIISNVPPETWPMVAPLRKLSCLLDSWVACVGYIVGQLDQFHVQTNIVRHNDPLSSIVKKPILHVPPFLEDWERGQVLQTLQKAGRGQ
jgi:hypothetical protein